MTAQTKKAPASTKVGIDVAKTGGTAPFTFRTVVSGILLAGNILVAAIYFHVINP
ncbi:MAG: photosystem I protein PsaX [Stigonema ocellatum SAG 48.90 = DSM 106950]|nr:photosystem I protein PsaX [Stigonema ocellatum SAG 48.90 = DSM 106950]